MVATEDGDTDDLTGAMDAVIGDWVGHIGATDTTLTDVITMIMILIVMNAPHTDIMTPLTGGATNRYGLQNELLLSLKKKRLLTIEEKSIGKCLIQPIEH